MLVEWDTDDFEQSMKGVDEQGGNKEHTIDQVICLFFALANNLSNSAYKELQAERNRVTT